MAKTSEVIIGGPGTGKTTALMDLVERHIESGIDPEKIAFLSFTRKGAEVAANRSIQKFSLEEKPRYFRTIHSLAYGELGLSRSEVMVNKDWREISHMTGVKITGLSAAEGNIMMRGEDGDKFMNVISLAHAMGIPLKEAWKGFQDYIDWYHLKYFYDTIQNYKEDTGKYDFSDMIDLYVKEGDDVLIDVLIVDEAQDLSKAQWKLIDKLSKHVKFIYYAGDDDQSIYRWSGADVDTFLRLGKLNPLRVLPVSYRLPDAVFRHASKVSARISRRIEKHWRPAEHPGSVEWIASPEELDLRKGSWILIARNFVFTQSFSEIARLQGVPFKVGDNSSVKAEHVKAIQFWEALRRGEKIKPGQLKTLKKYIHIDVEPERGREYAIEDVSRLRDIWHESLDLMPFDDRQYYLEMLRNGYKLTREPAVHIGTIHSVKGDEADNVVVATDLTWRSYESYTQEPDDEHRVFYVGMTRARKHLKLMTPQSHQWYDL